MPWRAKAEPWLKTETDHNYGEGGGEEEYRCGTSRCSFAFPCFRRWRHYRKTHGQKWQIEDEEKASRWAANKEMLRLRDESQTGTAVTYGASGTDTDAWAIVGTSLMKSLPTVRSTPQLRTGSDEVDD